MYRSRKSKDLVCGSTSTEFWHMSKSLDQCRGKVHQGWGLLPGGFALYQTALIRNALPFHVQFPNGKMMGWDCALSKAAHAAGFRLDLDGLLECEHRTKGDLE
mgnify:FL=1